MHRVIAIVWAACLLSATAASSQEFRVEYLDGRLEVLQGGRWKEAGLGDTVPSAATLRLAERAVAELAGGEARITLSQPGIYSTTELWRAFREASRWGLGRMLRDKLRFLFGRQSAETLTAMGARAEAVSEDPDLGWMDEEQEAFDRASRLLAEGQFEEAVPALQEALVTAGTETRPRYWYLIGFAYAMAGRSGPALKALEQAQPPPSVFYFADYALLKARLLVEGQGYGQALQLLDALQEASPAMEAAQTAWFLSAYCARQLGDQAAARERLGKAQALDPASDVGLQAAGMLSEP
jgi:tetratricopeptide (TPR) repeat protein